MGAVRYLTFNSKTNRALKGRNNFSLEANVENFPKIQERLALDFLASNQKWGGGKDDRTEYRETHPKSLAKKHNLDN